MADSDVMFLRVFALNAQTLKDRDTSFYANSEHRCKNVTPKLQKVKPIQQPLEIAAHYGTSPITETVGQPEESIISLKFPDCIDE